MKKLLIIGLIGLVLLNAGCLNFGKSSEKLINLNTATTQELENLSGIGPALAQRIIEKRPYNNVEEILKVKGIGSKKYAKIKSLITI